MAKDDLDSLIQRAYGKMEKGNYKGAIRDFNKAIKDFPNEPDGYFGKAEAAVGDPKLSLLEVLKLYRDATQRDPENDFYLTSSAEFCMSNGLLDQARDNYLKAAETVPENRVFFLNDLALGYTKYGLEFLQRLPRMTEESIQKDALNFMFKAYNIEKEKGVSIIENLEVQGKDPEYEKGEPWKLERMGPEREAIDKAPEASAFIKEAEKAGDPLLWIQFGQFCLDNGLLAHAVDSYEKAAELDEEAARDFYNELASGFFMQGSQSLDEDSHLQSSVKFSLFALDIPMKKAMELLKAE